MYFRVYGVKLRCKGVSEGCFGIICYGTRGSLLRVGVIAGFWWFRGVKNGGEKII